jgi:hypothetical protein
LILRNLYQSKLLTNVNDINDTVRQWNEKIRFDEANLIELDDDYEDDDPD